MASNGLVIEFSRYCQDMDEKSLKFFKKCYQTADFLFCKLREAGEEMRVEFENGSEVMRADYYWRGRVFYFLTQGRNDGFEKVNNRKWNFHEFQKDAFHRLRSQRKYEIFRINRIK